MFKKQIFIVTIAIVVFSMVLSACGAPATTAAPAQPAAAATSAPASSQPVTITMWHGFNAHEVDFLAGIIKKYSGPHPPQHQSDHRRQ